MTAILTQSSEPIVILEDASNAAQGLKDQLRQWRQDVLICSSIDEVLSFTHQLSSGVTTEIVFILDIDMGTGREREGLETITELKELRKQSALGFYIAVLTSHREFEAEAAAAGADVFLVKESHSIDALELLTRIEVRDIDRRTEQAKRRQAELAERGYKELRRRLVQLRNGHMEFLGKCVTSIQRALNWPLLPPNHQMVLSMISGPMSQAEKENKISHDVVELAIEGVDLLQREDSKEEQFVSWAARMKAASPKALLPWLSGNELSLMEDWELERDSKLSPERHLQANDIEGRTTRGE